MKLEVHESDVNRFLAIFEKNISHFDWSGFTKKLSDEFFSKSIQDTEINEDKMKSFLEKNSSILNDLADEHISKINWFETRSVKSDRKT